MYKKEVNKSLSNDYKKTPYSIREMKLN